MPRVRWLPTASTLVALPAGQEEVRLIRANLREMLDETGEDYLHVVSSPPSTAWVGQPYRYQIQVLASSSKLTFQAETAPDGFSVSPDGEVSWTPKSKPVGGIEQIVIAVSTGDKEVFQSFEVSVDRPAGRVASVGSSAEPECNASHRPTSQNRRPSSSRPWRWTRRSRLRPRRPARPGETRRPEPPAPSGVEEPVKISESQLEVPRASFRSHRALRSARISCCRVTA
jgi:hypothetical protein